MVPAWRWIVDLGLDLLVEIVLLHVFIHLKWAPAVESHLETALSLLYVYFVSVL